MTALFLKTNEIDTNDIKLNRAKTKKIIYVNMVLNTKSIKKKQELTKCETTLG